MFGGSGGGGGSGSIDGGPTSGAGGPSGGGGGGAILIASSTQITVNGVVTAKGGGGWAPGQFICSTRRSGPGSGGAIRLVAPQISGSGLLEAAGGNPGAVCSSGGSGRTRLEAFTQAFTGPASLPSFSTPGPVSSASVPALTNLPTLSISSIEGIASPSTPAGLYSTADISLPSGTINPVSMTLTMTNTPVGTTFTIRIIPEFATVISSTSTPSTGSFSNSTATGTLILPLGSVSVLNAYANFSIPEQIAAFIPSIEGEAFERILLTTNAGQASTLTLLTSSGKEILAKEFLGAEKLALLWKQIQSQK